MDFLHGANQAVQISVVVAQFNAYRRAVRNCVGLSRRADQGSRTEDDVSGNVHLHGAALAVDPLLARVASALEGAGETAVVREEPMQVVGWLLEVRGLLRSVRFAIAWDLHQDSPSARDCIEQWLGRATEGDQQLLHG